MLNDEHRTALPRLATPRIPPLAAEERGEQANELLSQTAGTVDEALNIFATLARHPGLFRRWLPFGGKLLAGKLPGRDRELLILRTASNCGSAYEWGHHERMGAAEGLTADEIRRVQIGPDADDWAPFDRTLLVAADELHRDACIGDHTWHALAERYDERQLIELPMLVGHYHLLAFTLNSLGVQPEPGIADIQE